MSRWCACGGHRADVAHLEIKCADCGETWIDAYGGGFVCPSCESSSQQEFVTGYIGLVGPHTIERQVFPGDDDWPH